MKTKQYHILKVINLLLLFSIVSCSNSNERIKVGKYASEYPSSLTKMYYRYILNYKGYTIGDTLTIYENKDFRYHTCGGNTFGKYRVSNDMLFLNIDSSITHRDKKVYNENFTDTFYIKNENYIEYKFRAKNTRESKETFKSITRFFYINEERK